MSRIKIIIIMLLITVAASAVTPVKRWGQLQVIGNQLCDSRGEPVVLRGVSLGWHNLWPRFLQCKVCEVAPRRLALYRAACGNGCMH